MSALDLIWIGPARETSDLRPLKEHMDSGGSLQVKQSSDNASFLANVFREGIESHASTTDAGLVLRVGVTLSATPNPLEEQTAAAQGVYITRDGASRPDKPTVAEYALVTRPHAMMAADAQIIVITALKWSFPPIRLQSSGDLVGSVHRSSERVVLLDSRKFDSPALDVSCLPSADCRIKYLSHDDVS